MPSFAIHSGPAARVGVFLDAQNIFRSLKYLQFKKKLDYKKMLTKTLAGRTLYCAQFYDIIGEDSPAKSDFLDIVRRCGYAVFTKTAQVFADGTSKGDWDLGMAIDMILIAKKLDVVVLCSGDGDFIPLVKYLKQETQCRVEGVSILRTTNSALLAEFDSHIDLGAAEHIDLYKP